MHQIMGIYLGVCWFYLEQHQFIALTSMMDTSTTQGEGAIVNWL